jgi:signal transduction histidine kinase
VAPNTAVSRSGEVLGGLFFGHAQPGVFTERAERIAAGLAAQASIAMDNARLFEQTQAVLRSRDEFLGSAAHDLKTPLTSIKGISQVLRRRVERNGTVDPDRLAAGLVSIDASATRMSQQIDELLDLARSPGGQPLQLQREQTDLVTLARQVIADQEPAARRQQIHLEVADQHIVGAWDRVRLLRVLENLIGNAIKYSPDDRPIVVEISRQTADGAHWAVLSVRDRGVGIPTTDLPHVFERFFRGGNITADIAGTGIGLASARQIVEQHAGTISVESHEGQGSTFTVRLPLLSGGAD